MITLETTYYIVGIIAMSLWIVVAVAAIVLVIETRNRIINFQTGVRGRIAALFQQRNASAAAAVGLSVGKFIVEKLKKRAKDSSLHR